MALTPTAAQRIVLWHLATTAEGVETDGGLVRGFFPKDKLLSFDKDAREPLERAGLIETTRRTSPSSGSTAMFLTLTPAGWRWLESHVDESIGFKGPAASQVLGQALRLMQVIHATPSLVNTPSLGESLRLAQETLPLVPPASRGRPSPSTATKARANGRPSAPRSPGRRPAAGPAPVPPEEAIARIEAACLALGRGRRNVEVRLAALRKQVADLPRATTDEALTTLSRQNRVSLWPVDDPAEITGEDEDAAYINEAGQRRYLLYYNGDAR